MFCFLTIAITEVLILQVVRLCLYILGHYVCYIFLYKKVKNQIYREKQGFFFFHYLRVRLFNV